MLSVLWLTPKVQAEECVHSFSANHLGHQAELTLKGNCNRGMYILNVTRADGEQQTILQAYSSPIGGLWMSRLTGNASPDVLIATVQNEKLIKLQLYSWMNHRLTEKNMGALTTEQLAGYLAKDKVYVRLNKIVRQIQVESPSGPMWRRFSYDFASKSWIGDD